MVRTISKSPNGLFSVIIDPVNSIETALETGRFNSVSRWILEDYNRVPLVQTTERKRIYFVPMIDSVSSGKEELYVSKFNLVLCENTPNYLLGAMVNLKERDLPEELDGKGIIAIDRNTNTVFESEFYDRCTLHVCRKSSQRRLRLCGLDFNWEVERGLMLLAEEPKYYYN